MFLLRIKITIKHELHELTLITQIIHPQPEYKSIFGDDKLLNVIRSLVHTHNPKFKIRVIRVIRI